MQLKPFEEMMMQAKSLIDFGGLSVIIIRPMKLQAFVAPKGPFADGQRWKLVFVHFQDTHKLDQKSHSLCSLRPFKGNQPIGG